MEKLKALITSVQVWLGMALASGGALSEMLPDLVAQVTGAYESILVIVGGLLVAVRGAWEKVKAPQ